MASKNGAAANRRTGYRRQESPPVFGSVVKKLGNSELTNLWNPCQAFRIVRRKGVISSRKDEYEIIFRMWYRNKWTGRIVRSKDGRPIPLRVRRRR